MTESSEASSESRGGGSGDLEEVSLIMNSSIVAVPVIEVPFFVVTPGTMETTSQSDVGFKEQIDMKHQSQVEMKAENTHSLSDPITQKASSLFQYLNTNEDIISPKALQLSTSNKKPQSTHLIVKTTSSDGYNWRKYGQKQVKSSEHSRSYFRCTQANCCAKKKVEHYRDGHVIEIIYRGQHNHELPQKTNFLKEQVSHCSMPESGKKNSLISRLEYNGLNICTTKAENESCNKASEQMHRSNVCERDHHGIKTEGDFTNEPEPKRRFCENSANYSAPLMKTVKEPKVVIQASFDSGIVNDGYRWRKYGQKIVKGNPNPRSYYKCTNTGCPVRKHVEKALEDVKSVIITYEGKHNHDVPPCKNGNETSTPKLLVPPYEKPLLEASRHETQSKNPQDQGGGKMVLESAKTLLSIGSKSSSGDNGKNKTSNSDVIQSPLLDRSCLTVSVQNS